MKILGIAGSTRKEKQSGVYTLVQTVLENTGCEYELISLKGKKISGCIACLGCVKDNICKKVGVPYMLYGEGVKITEEMIPNVSKQPEAMKAAVDAGKLLRQRLIEGHDRIQVTQKMQQKFMEMLEGSA
ncbi:MAG: NAD(P)H-dependent oxidoreductase [Proteobacteria bacterium]|nr:NAD(P)H-dependent oxidoreductase [Pseudomonadota bacterium]